jgi:hypothetical protein
VSSNSHDDGSDFSQLPRPSYEPSIWNGYYDKVFYWVHLPGGERVECWPNAGWMNATDGSGRHWSPEDKPIVSIQRDAESRLFRPDKLRELQGIDPGEPGGGRSVVTAIHATGRGMQVISAAQVMRDMRGMLREVPITHPLLTTGDKLRLERARAKRERKQAKRRHT